MALVPRRAALVALLAATLAGCGGSDAPGGAEPAGFETVVQDDALLLHRPAELPQTIRTLKALGVNRVRINATWSQIQPTENGPRNWTNPDRAVKAATAGGLRVMLDVGFFAPRWAGGSRSPDPAKLAAFAHAGRALPAGAPVDDLERAQPPRLHAAAVARRAAGRPHVYRRMHELGYDAIKGASKDNRVLLGGLTSMGGRRPRTACARCASCASWPAWTSACSRCAARVRGLQAAEGRRLRHAPLRAQAAAHPAAAQPRRRGDGRPGPATRACWPRCTTAAASRGGSPST